MRCILIALVCILDVVPIASLAVAYLASRLLFCLALTFRRGYERFTSNLLHDAESIYSSALGYPRRGDLDETQILNSIDLFAQYQAIAQVRNLFFFFFVIAE